MYQSLKESPPAANSKSRDERALLISRYDGMVHDESSGIFMS